MEIILENLETLKDTINIIDSSQKNEDLDTDFSSLEAYENRNIDDFKLAISNNMESSIDQFCVAPLNGLNRKALLDLTSNTTDKNTTNTNVFTEKENFKKNKELEGIYSRVSQRLMRGVKLYPGNNSKGIIGRVSSRANINKVVSTNILNGNIKARNNNLGQDSFNIDCLNLYLNN